MKIVEVYTDGTIIKGIPGWCFAVVENDKVIHEAGGILTNPELAAIRNIASELKAVMEAVRYAKKNNFKVIIWTDLQGNVKWVADLLNPNKKPWKTNSKWTQLYREFMFANKT